VFVSGLFLPICSYSCYCNMNAILWDTGTGNKRNGTVFVCLKGFMSVNGNDSV
jgi:hypothetical protein